MARLIRPYAPGVVQHLVQRAAADRTLFADAEPGDYEHALALLADASRRFGLAIHAYVLLPREIRLIGTPTGPDTTSRVFQALGRGISPRVQRRDGRTGALWERRYRSALLDAEGHLLAAMRYVERRPLAIGRAASALEWPWSSAAHHVGMRQDPLVNDHPVYWSIRDTPFGRQAAYRELLEASPGTDADAAIERSVDTGWAIGDDAFVAGASAAAGRRLAPRASGRPRKPSTLTPIKRTGLAG